MNITNSLGLKVASRLHYLFVLLCFSLVLSPATAQKQTKIVTIKGVVMDSDLEPLTGATIQVKDNPSKGAIADIDGYYEIHGVTIGTELEISFIGYVTQTKKVVSDAPMNVRLYEDQHVLDEVEIVAFGTQKKESITSAITTVAPAELKVPSSNLTTALGGRLAGMISYQRTGEPGADDADFFIRGITTFGDGRANPLILIDNIELSTADLSRLNPDDIESFSVMKDATATALYGARGANGVILVKTKEGQRGKAKLNIRYEGSLSQPTKNIAMADPITYMRMHNEAILTRDPLAPVFYSDDKIDRTIPGSGSYIYPSTNWRDELTKNHSFNNRVNLNVSGGGDVVTYYVAAAFSQDTGNLKMDKVNNFNSNIDLKKYSLRSNVNIDITKTTKMKVRLSGSFDDYNGPRHSGNTIYGMTMKANPVLFPPKYPKDEEHKYVNHIMFGNYADGNFLNPYAQLVKGYKESSRSNMSAQMELIQTLDFITKGLQVRGLMHVSRISNYSMIREYKPFYYGLSEYNYLDNTYTIEQLNENGTEYLGYSPSSKDIEASTYIEAAANYDRTFNDKHDVSGMLVLQLNERSMPNQGSLQASLPKKNIGLSGRFTYGFDSKYFTEFNFGYNGSERFAKKYRFGFFPSAGLGWMISNEPFFEPLKKTISKLKLRASYGLVGNDKISSDSNRFLYLSDINMNNNDTGASFGYENGYRRPGIGINRYADPTITWEKSTKMNLALELDLFDEISIIAEYYTDKRRNILQNRIIPNSVGLWATPKGNFGKAKGSGFDISIDYNKVIRNDFWIQGRGNFTFAKSKLTAKEELDYGDNWWRSEIGYPTTQQWGLIAEGLFVDDEEVANSPTQTFGEYGAGDIKYKDLNNDGKIDDLDRAPIGYPTAPEIVYGFGLSVGYKSWDVSVFFQGVARESFWIDYNNVSPFFDTTGSGFKGHNALAKFIANDYWSEDNRNPYALWPRLSPSSISNNNQRSTWFMRDGSFLRLKQLEVGYTFPKQWVSKFYASNLRIYLSGSNLLSFSKFKLWDPEMGSNGLGYPLQRVFNLGINLSF